MERPESFRLGPLYQRIVSQLLSALPLRPIVGKRRELKRGGPNLRPVTGDQRRFNLRDIFDRDGLGLGQFMQFAILRERPVSPSL
jgi:hypothetical protein